MKPEYKPVRAVACSGECKHDRKVKLEMSELEKLREKVARLEGGISKGEMVYLEVCFLSFNLCRLFMVLWRTN